MKKYIEKIGVVVSDKMDKTRVVMVEFMTQHPLYKKTIRKRRKFMAHDEDNATKVGDIVRIIQTRPLSRHKRWKILEILGRKEDILEKVKKEGEPSGTTENNASSG
ncbi:MAG: 30S ribosomal protein S17 [candidate division WOR-3 bacterium]|nr:30S ribosomal protein S17 [Candidatus Omnitrophota bacterium]MCM8807265.1 30S ribosomal protein S17 [Candidatus Omnitrophota bacterium]